LERDGAETVGERHVHFRGKNPLLRQSVCVALALADFIVLPDKFRLLRGISASDRPRQPASGSNRISNSDLAALFSLVSLRLQNVKTAGPRKANFVGVLLADSL
jgi:hypothetical protein